MGPFFVSSWEGVRAWLGRSEDSLHSLETELELRDWSWAGPSGYMCVVRVRVCMHVYYSSGAIHFGFRERSLTGGSQGPPFSTSGFISLCPSARPFSLGLAIELRSLCL